MFFLNFIEVGGFLTRDRVLHELDVIAHATGFHADRFIRLMCGRNGAAPESLWQRGPKTYLEITRPDFPNFFMLNPPNGRWATFC